MHRTALCLFVLCGYGIWAHTLRKGHRFRLFKNRVVRKIFGCEGEEVTNVWRYSQSEELHDFCPHQILFRWSNQGGWDGQGMVHVWHRREVLVVFWWWNWRKDTTQKIKHRWENNVKTYLKEREWEYMDWMNLARDGETWDFVWTQ